jgi:2',3'-cyclic-nucleotide 2'-phosphodiesterase
MPASPEAPLKIIMLGDVVGKAGCRAVYTMTKSLKKEFNADLVAVNGENAVDGSGLTPEIVADFFKAGVDVITSGNHIWKNKTIYPLLDNENRLLRPENYPKGTPGKGHCTIEARGVPVCFINLEGQLNRARLRCPFGTARDMIHKLKKECRHIVIDFHAETAQEKEALAAYLDGEVSLVLGTHTHVQTADERILPGGTGYITDIGMSGPAESVIGMSVKIAIDRALTQMPLKLEVEDRPAMVMGLVIELDIQSGKTVGLRRFQRQSEI